MNQVPLIQIEKLVIAKLKCPKTEVFRKVRWFLAIQWARSCYEEPVQDLAEAAIEGWFPKLKTRDEVIKYCKEIYEDDQSIEGFVDELVKFYK